MEFRLFYRGLLPAGSSGKADDKHRIRQAFRPQLAELWKQRRISEVKLDFFIEHHHKAMVTQRGDYRFLPLIGTFTKLACKLGILFLRPGEPGNIRTQSGDIDNRLKNLLDALTVPPHNQVVGSPSDEEQPYFHCLLENDNLVTSINIETDRLLQPHSPDEVVLVIHVSAYALELNGISVILGN